MTLFSELQNSTNLFEITDSDVEEAQFPDNILSDDKEDDDLVIDWLIENISFLSLYLKKTKS